MADRPYFLVLEATIAGNGTGTVSYTMPGNERVELHELVYVSTGRFNITDIRDSTGLHYTNASPSVEIPSDVLASGTNSNNALQKLPLPLVIESGVTLYIDLEDASGLSNTITLVFTGVRMTA